MDKESIIKSITKEVYQYMKQQNMPIIDNNDSQIILADMRPQAKFTDIECILAEANNQKREVVCIPQWFVSFAKERLEGHELKVATVIGLPGGTTSPYAKYAEVKQAVTNGADMILIPINMEFCMSGDIHMVKKDLSESMVAAKRKAEIIAIIEVKDLDEQKIQKIAEACLSCGVDGVMLSCATGGELKPNIIRNLKTKGLHVGVYGGVSDMMLQNHFRQAGARWITIICR